MPQIASDLISVFKRDGVYIYPTNLSRGPWRADAQHGGAPAGLLAQIAIECIENDQFVLQRFAIDILKSVPIEPLQIRRSLEVDSRSVKRVNLELLNKNKESVCIARTLFSRTEALEHDDISQKRSIARLSDSLENTVHIPETELDIETFHYGAIESRLAGGSVELPGPAAAWFRFRYPLLPDINCDISACAVAISDLGNGISWVLPFKKFTFASINLTVNFWRTPKTEWIGLSSITFAGNRNFGCTISDLYDEEGLLGCAVQNLLFRAR